MTKKQVVWLITKLIGVYFAYSAIVAVPVVISSIYRYVSLPSPPRFAKSENPAANNSQTISPTYPNNPSLTNPALNNPAVPKTETETPAEKAKNDALKELLWNLFATVFYGLIGWYLIRDGRFFYTVLNREEPFDESGKPVESDSFPLSKKKEEVVTSLNLSGGKGEITSLNLSDSTPEQAPTPIIQPIIPPVTSPVVPPAVSPEMPAAPSEINQTNETYETNQLNEASPENLLEIPPDEQK
jgi:cytoskeletal protein RodZ